MSDKDCFATASHCLCVLPDDGHDVHKCVCGGSWTGDARNGDDAWAPVTFPDLLPVAAQRHSERMRDLL